MDEILELDLDALNASDPLYLSHSELLELAELIETGTLPEC